MTPCSPRRSAALGLAFASLAACAHTAVPVQEPSAMKAKLDQPVALEGIARNAKGGAVVLVGESPVYLEGLESWPAGLDGSAVRVTGTLREKKSLPDPVNERGELVQGAWGAQLVLEAPKWERR